MGDLGLKGLRDMRFMGLGGLRVSGGSELSDLGSWGFEAALGIRCSQECSIFGLYAFRKAFAIYGVGVVVGT